MPDLAECPSCGRKTLVTRNADLYQCILCDFKRDLSKSEKPSSGNEMPWLLLVVFFVLVVFLLDGGVRPEPASQPYYTPFQLDAVRGRDMERGSISLPRTASN